MVEDFEEEDCSSSMPLQRSRQYLESRSLISVERNLLHSQALTRMVELEVSLSPLMLQSLIDMLRRGRRLSSDHLQKSDGTGLDSIRLEPGRREWNER